MAGDDAPRFVEAEIILSEFEGDGVFITRRSGARAKAGLFRCQPRHLQSLCACGIEATCAQPVFNFVRIRETRSEPTARRLRQGRAVRQFIKTFFEDFDNLVDVLLWVVLLVWHGLFGSLLSLHFQSIVRQKQLRGAQLSGEGFRFYPRSRKRKEGSFISVLCRSRIICQALMMNFQNMKCSIVAVGGFASDTGKTTLMCELLRRLPGWEAIKMTRGHYRSCGKDPHACCVSHLLSDQPVLRSGRAATDAHGKDTGRYWEAGAANVHWVVVTDGQVERGIKLALERVEAEGVLIEGNSFMQFVEADYALMAARAGGGKIKPSARRALLKSSALYLFEDGVEDAPAPQRFQQWRATHAAEDALIGDLPLFTQDDLPLIVERIQSIQAERRGELRGALLA